MNRKAKLSMPYKVKDENPNPILDMDDKVGTVKMVWNTYNYLDDDGDVLLPGCSSKSISERGAGASVAAIKHALFHNIQRIPGKVTHLAEEQYESDGKVMTGIVAVSQLALDTEDGRDTYLKYQAGIYDNHSIGFRYLNLSFVEPDSESWKRLEAAIINREKMAVASARYGGVWAVSEIKLYEGSTVAFGANDMTPVLGIKGNRDCKASREEMLNILFKREDMLLKALRTGQFTDSTMIDFEIQYKQCQQAILELSQHEPSKITHESREEHSASKEAFDITRINKTLNY